MIVVSIGSDAELVLASSDCSGLYGIPMAMSPAERGVRQ